MGTLYLMRHGETDYHAQQRLLGRKDASLNDKGREQAELAARHFSGLDLAAIYSSTLARCLETAGPTSRDKGIEIQKLQGLMEVDMGDWDGQLIDDLLNQESELLGRWMQSPSTVAIPGGEDFKAVRERVMGAVDEITSRHVDNEEVLVVTHGGPIRGILCEALDLELNNMFKIQIDLCSISIVKYSQGEFSRTSRVLLVNDTSHLK